MSIFGMETISDRVRARMKALDLTQKSLAGLCGVSQPTIGRFLNGETDNIFYIYELSKALETSVRWLKTGIDDDEGKFPQGGTKVTGGAGDTGYTGNVFTGDDYLQLAKTLAMVDSLSNHQQRLVLEHLKNKLQITELPAIEEDEVGDIETIKSPLVGGAGNKNKTGKSK